MTFFETTFRIAEKHLLNANILDDETFHPELDLLLACILRLVNVCVSVMALLLPHSSMVKRACLLWKVISSLCSHPNLTYETIEFILLVLCSPSNHLDTVDDVMPFLNGLMIEQARTSYNSRIMFGVVKIANAVATCDPEGSIKVGLIIKSLCPCHRLGLCRAVCTSCYSS